MNIGTDNPDGAATADTSLDLDSASELDFEEPLEQPAPEKAKPKKPAPPSREPEPDEADVEETEGDDDEEVAEDPDELDPDEDPDEDDEQEEGEGEAEELGETDLKKLVTLPNGEKKTLQDAINGYMAREDYSKKTSETAIHARANVERTQRLDVVLDRLTGYLEGFIPPEPDPMLAQGTPEQQSLYLKQQSRHQAAVTKMAELLDVKDGVQQERQAIDMDQIREISERENAALVGKLKFLADPKKRAKYNDLVMNAALKVGYTEAEVARNLSHKNWLLGYWAHRGMKAAQSQKKAEERIAKVPGVKPPSRGNADRNAVSKSKFINNKKAMARLEKSGDINDAVEIDFE